MKRVDIAGIALEASSGAPLVVLREQDEPHRLLPIFIGGVEASAIALAATGQAPPRPLTHDVMAALIDSLDGHLDAVEVTELTDGTFFASLNVSGPAGERRVDSRPSDAIALAVRAGAPVFVSESVLDEAGSLPDAEGAEAQLDEGAIDAAVESFRSFLDDVDPDAFALPTLEAGESDDVGDAVPDDGADDPST